MFNVNDLYAEIASNGIMRNNRFKVVFPIPLSISQATVQGVGQFKTTNRLLELYCESANIPGVALMMEEIRRYGYGVNEKRPFAPLFTDMSFTFRGDAKGNVWNFMTAWMKSSISYEGSRDNKTMGSLAGPITNQYPMEVGYKFDTLNNEGYTSDVTLSVYSDDGTEQMKIVMSQAFPIYVGDIPLNWAARSDYMRIPVTFTFFSWYNALLPTNNTNNNGG